MDKQVGLIDSEQPSAKVKPEAYMKAAKHVCKLSLKAANQTYTSVAESDLPYLCMDLVYQYTLLKDGFGMLPLLCPFSNINTVFRHQDYDFTVFAISKQT